MSNLNRDTGVSETAGRIVLTSLRATFQPIAGVAISSKASSLPRYTRALLVEHDDTADLYAWVDASPYCQPDYIREHVPPFEYIEQGGASNA